MGGGGRRGDDDGRRQEMSGDLRDFFGERCDVSVPTMKDLGRHLRERWANLCQPPDAKVHTRLGVGGYSSRF